MTETETQLSDERQGNGDHSIDKPFEKSGCEGEAKDTVEAGRGCEWGQERTFLRLGGLEPVLRGAR